VIDFKSKLLRIIVGANKYKSDRPAPQRECLNGYVFYINGSDGFMIGGVGSGKLQVASCCERVSGLWFRVQIK